MTGRGQLACVVGLAPPVPCVGVAARAAYRASLAALLGVARRQVHRARDRPPVR